MASFPSALSSPQYTTLRTSGYWARTLACVNDNAIVMQARASQSITTEPFIQFTFDTVTTGAYTDVWEGMVVFISSTTDLRTAKYRGRVRLAPTSSIFYISRNSTLLNDNDYITVVRDTDLFTRFRDDTLVDSSIAYHATPDVLTGLPSAIVLYDSDNNNSVSYTTTQSPVRVAAGSVSTTTWAWSVSGAGASSISNTAIQNPTITFTPGYHYLIRVRHTNNLGQTNYQISHVYAITRTFTAPCLQSIVTGTVSADLDTGWTANLTAYAQVDTLLDRTHCAVFTVEHFGDNSAAPLVSNVLMNGRIRSDSIQTQGSAEAGRIASVSFVVEGITASLGRATIPNDIIRATSAPDEWGEMTSPNPYRMAVYAAWTYTTLTNICSFGVEAGAFADWEIGGEPRGIDGGFVGAVLKNILEPIHAAVNFAPDGSLYLARTVSYLADRSGVVTVATLTLSDLIDYSVERENVKTTSQVVAYGGMFNATTNTFDIYSAQSPSIVYLEGDAQELTREILAANSTIEDATSEIAARAANHYGVENPKPLLQAQLFDSWAGLLIPTNYLRWNATLPASSNTLNMAYGASNFWQLQSVSLTINPDGTIDTSFTAPAETSFSEAQTLAALLPNNLSNMNPVLPILPSDPAFPTDPLENYPTDAPVTEDLQPTDPFSGAQAYTPWPPDVAAQVALRTGRARCKVIAVNWRNNTNAESGWTTVLGDDYLMTIDGYAGIERAPACIDAANFTQGTVISQVGSVFTVEAENVAGAVPWRMQWMDGTNVDLCCTLEPLVPIVGMWTTGQIITCAGASIPSSSLPASVRYFWLGRATTFTVEVTFSSSAGGGFSKWADAFYEWEEDEEGNPINISLLTDGLYIDNAKYDPVALGAPFPPFSENHRYSGLPFVGTNNSFLSRMVLPSYTDNQNVYLNITVCPKDAAL